MDRSTFWGECWAEFVGTTILMVFGDGVVANVLYHPRLASGAYSWDTIVVGWAFAVAMAVYVAGGVTAHINPAVTLANLVRRGLPLRKGIGYIVAQVCGAFLGGAIVYGAYWGGIVAQGFKNAFYTGAAGPTYSIWNCFFVEMLGTFFLVAFIFALVDNANNQGPGANMGPFMIGMAVLAIGASLGGPSGYAINPARDFGPRLMCYLMAGDTKGFVGNYWWLVPIIGPLIGGVIGALFYDFTIVPLLPNVRNKKAQELGQDNNIAV